MIELSVRELNKYYGSNHILRDISFEIMGGEKVGLLGKNGCGKTTLFKVLSGREEYESGEIAKATGKKIELLDQMPRFDEKYTVLDVLHTAFEEALRLAEEMRALEETIRSDSKPSLLARYGQLQTQYETAGGYDLESRIDRICTGMGIGEELKGQLFSTLSGGEQTRVNLARILLRESDILLLDEPTNHLDMVSLEWLEGYLNSFQGTVIAISHDRCFLDNVVTRIIEMEERGLSFYLGNYTAYAAEKERRLALQNELYDQQQKKIGQLEEAAKRMHEWAKRADSPAMHRRAFSIEKRIERIDRVERPKTDKGIDSEFKQKNFSGAEIVTLKNISKSYIGKRLFSRINLTVHKGDRVALIGANGCGKSTLVKLILGEETPDEGIARLGGSVKAAYLPQTVEFEEEALSVLETVCRLPGMNEERARFTLAGFHFRGEDIFKKTGTLSGGERSRLKLCFLMQGDCNLLILDEPTNHLDIASREWIEDAMAGFSGTILFISHDRYFLNKFASRVWEMKDGGITDFDGSFQGYIEKRKLAEQTAQKAAPVREKKGKPVSEKAREQSETAKRQKRAEEFECHIARTEEELRQLALRMEEAASDAPKLAKLFGEKTVLEKTLEELYESWSTVEDK